MPEVQMNSLLGERALRTKVGDFQRLLLRQASGHDFPEQSDHFAIIQRPLVPFQNTPQYLRLPFRAVVIHCFFMLPFALAHTKSQPRTIADQLLDILIQAIDFLPDLLQIC